jgi:Ni,Fe-hydrogenase III large subunit
MTPQPDGSRAGYPLSVERVPLEELQFRLTEVLKQGGRLGLLTARRSLESEGMGLIALALSPGTHSMALWETALPNDRYPSLTPKAPQAHWSERAIYDFFGIMPKGHPRFKSVILHEAWPEGFHPLREPISKMPAKGPPRSGYKFLAVKGEGAYEIPVGPIHAGIIEPGHFRFSCLGEVIQNLEIRLGFQHRGIERQMTELSWQRARFLAEAASSDTSAGNAWAHAMALEDILSILPPVTAVYLRALALEIERVASHIGDLGGICSDIGFAAGASIFGCLRGKSLGLAERLTGSRFLTSYIVPGGVSRGLDAAGRKELSLQANALAADYEGAEPILLENSGALERMEGTGKVRPSLARDFGLVGPAGRASGVKYDVRDAFLQVPYASFKWQPAHAEDGDVLARVRIRADETRTSLSLIQSLLDAAPDDVHRVSVPDTLPPERVGMGIVEAWRGELIHLLFTDKNGNIARYCIKDPSFNNWTGLAIAARGELVADFPLCNKSFGLSYCGNDL